MIKVTGLWSNETKNGGKYLAGSLGSARLLIFKNTYKKEDTHPDFVLYIDENKRKSEKDAEGSASAAAVGLSAPLGDDLPDLPF